MLPGLIILTPCVQYMTFVTEVTDHERVIRLSCTLFFSLGQFGTAPSVLSWLRPTSAKERLRASTLDPNEDSSAATIDISGDMDLLG